MPDPYTSNLTTAKKDPYLTKVASKARYTPSVKTEDQRLYTPDMPDGVSVGSLFRQLDVNAVGPSAEQNQYLQDMTDYLTGFYINKSTEGETLSPDDKIFASMLMSSMTGRDTTEILGDFDRYSEAFTGIKTNKNFLQNWGDYFSGHWDRKEITNATMMLTDIPYDSPRRQYYEKYRDDLQEAYAKKTANVSTKSGVLRNIAQSGDIMGQSVDQLIRAIEMGLVTSATLSLMLSGVGAPAGVAMGTTTGLAAIQAAQSVKKAYSVGSTLSSIQYTVNEMAKAEGAEIADRLMSMVDEHGNRIPLDIVKSYAYTGGLLSAVTELSDNIITPIGSLKFGTKTVGEFFKYTKQMVEKNAAGYLGLFAANTAFQVGQEGLQGWIREKFIDDAVKKANESGATSFTDYQPKSASSDTSWDVFMKEAVEALPSLVITGAVGAVGGGVGAYAYAGAAYVTKSLERKMQITSQMKSDASKYFNESGKVYDIGYIDTVGEDGVDHYAPKKTEDGKQAEQRKAAPIFMYVNKNTGALVPVYRKDRQYVEYLRENGVTGVKGIIINEEALTKAGETASASSLASVLAMRIGSESPVMGYDGNTIIMEDQNGVDAAVEDIQSYSDTMSPDVEVQQNEDGSYRIMWENTRGTTQTINVRAKNESDQMVAQNDETEEITGNVRPVRTMKGDAMNGLFNSNIRKSESETLADAELEMAAKYFYQQMTGLTSDQIDELWKSDYQAIIDKLPQGVDETTIEEGARFMPLLSAVTGRSTEDLISDPDNRISLEYLGKAKEASYATGEKGLIAGSFDVSYDEVEDKDTGKKRTVRTYHIGLSDAAHISGTDLVHELMHVARRMASPERLAGFKKAYGDHDLWVEDVKQVGDKWVFNGKEYNSRQEAERNGAEEYEERFVHDFFEYLRTGNAPNAEIAGFFGALKQFLQSFARAFSDNFSEDTRRAFDMLLNGQLDVQPGQTIEEAVEASERTLTDDVEAQEEEEQDYASIEEAEEVYNRELERIGGRKILEGSLRMDVSSVAELFNLAEEASDEFRSIVADIAEKFGFENVSYRPVLKWYKRTIEKAINDYEGDLGRVLDVNGATIVLPSIPATIENFERIKAALGDKLVKSKRTDTPYGYKDFKFNFRTSNGFIGELILVDENTAWMKDNEDGIGHDIYAQGRKLEPYLKQEKEQYKRYQELFGMDVWSGIKALDRELGAWSTTAYENAKAIKEGQYDSEGFRANWKAVSDEITELSRQLRSNFAASYSDGLSSYTLPSGDLLNTESSQVSSSLLKGVSQISKYLTAIVENSSTESIPQNGQTGNTLHSLSPQWQTMDANTQRRIEADYEYIRNQYIGTDKWMKAPNGKPTNLTERQWVIVRTPAFKEWFGDWENDPENSSKVLDENGEPLVVYHGTTAVFDTFSDEFRGRTGFPDTQVGEAYFFTTDRLTALSVAAYGNETVGNERIMEVFLNIRNMGEYDPSMWGKPDVINTELMANLIEANKRGAKDGSVYRSEAMGDTYVIFSKNQVKSATDNIGTFSRDNDSILYSLTAPQQALETEISSVMENALNPEITTEQLRQALGVGTDEELSVADILFRLSENTRMAMEAAGIDLTQMGDEAVKIVGRQWADEIDMRVKFMPKDNNPLGWYSKNVDDAMRIYSELYPELKEDLDARVAFLIPLAITSNGETVLNNGSIAAKMYEYYKKHGRYPTGKSIINTVRWISMGKGFDKINLLMDWGMSKTDIAKLLLTGMSPDEILSISGVKSISGVSRGARGVLFSNILGPKIGGGFLANLLGWHKVGTFDLWMNRLMKRSTGLVEYYDKDTSKHKAGEVKDAMSFSVTQRQFMTSAIEEAVRIYNETHDGTPLTVADAQAVLWYNEKNLYDKMEKQAFTSIGASYVDSAGELLARKNVPGYNKIKDNNKKAEIRRREIQRVLDSYGNDSRTGETALESGPSDNRQGALGDGGQLSPAYADQGQDNAGSAAGGEGAQGLSGEADAGYRRDNEDQYLGGTTFGDLVSGRWLRDTVSEGGLFRNGQRDRRSLARRGLLSRSGLLNSEPYGKKIKETGKFEAKSASKRISGKKFTVKSRNTISTRYSSTVWMASGGRRMLDINKAFFELDNSDRASLDSYVSLMQSNAETQGKNKWRLSPYTSDDIAKDKIFISEDGNIGFRVTEDGDLVGVVSNSEEKGSIYYIMPLAIANGATKLDCFASDNSQLPRIYSKFGFKAVAKVQFNFNELDESVKEGWKANDLGEPDVVFMVFDQKAANDNFEMQNIVENTDVSQYSDYGAAIDIQNEAVEALKQSNIDNDRFVEEAEEEEQEETPESSGKLWSLSPAKQAEILQARKAEIQKAVENDIFVSTEYLNEFRGEEWADNELSLRDWMKDNPDVIDMAKESDSVEDFKKRYLKDEDNPDAETKREPLDDAWFTKIWEYANASSAEDRDRQFAAEWTSSEDKTLELVNVLRGYMDKAWNPKRRTGGFGDTRNLYSAFKDIPQSFRRLNDGRQGNRVERSSSEDIKAAQELIRKNPRAFRNAYMMATGIRDSMELVDDDIAREIEELEAEETAKRMLRTDYRTTVKDLRQKLNDAERDIRKAGEDPEKLDAKATQEKLQTVRQRVKDISAQVKAAQNEVDQIIGRMGNQIEKGNDRLNERRARVAELRSELTKANREERRLSNALDALRRWKEAKEASDYRKARIKTIRRQANFNPASIDATYQDVLLWIAGLFERTAEDIEGRRDIDERIAAKKMEIDRLKSQNEDTSAAQQELLNLRNQKRVSRMVEPPALFKEYLPASYAIVRADNRQSQWTAEELDVILEALRKMRRDGREMLDAKQNARTARLLGIGYQYFMNRVGRLAQLTDEGEMNARALMEDVMKSLPEAEESGPIKSFILSYAKLQRLARILDGDTEGVLYDWFVRQNYEHQAEELRQIRRRLEAAQKKWNELGLKGKDLSKEGFKGTKQNGTEYTLTRGQMIGVYVYSQNEIGKEKLTHYAGNNISEADINAIISKLTPEEKAWGDYMMQDFEENWQRLADVYYRGWNMNLGKRDNYFTFVASAAATEEQLANGVDPQGDMVGKDGKMYTDKGFTKEINPFAVYPLELDVTRSWNWQVRKQEHFMAYGEWAKDTQYLFEHSQIMNLAERTVGKAEAENLRKIVQSIIGGQVTQNDFDRSYTKWLAKRNSAVLIGNVGTILKQGPSWFAAFNGDVDVSKALKNAVALNASFRAFMAEHPQIAAMFKADVDTAAKFIWANAPEMKDRQIDMDIMEQLSRMDGNRFANLLNPANRMIAKWTIGLVDRMVVNNLWMSRYYTVFDQQKAEGKTDAQAHREAAFKASQFISETQPTSARMDQSSKQIDAKSSAFLRSIMVFTNQVVNTFNQMYIDIPMAFRQKNWKKAVAKIASTMFMVSTVALLSGKFWKKKGEDDEKYRLRLAREILATLIQTSAPGFGSIVAAGLEYDRDYSTYIFGLDTVGSALKTIFTKNERKTGWDKLADVMEDLGTEAGYAVGLPVTPVKNVVKSVREGEPGYLLGGTWGQIIESLR